MHDDPCPPSANRCSRRELLKLGGAVAAGVAGGAGAVAWWRSRERGWRAEVFIGKALGYDAGLQQIIHQGLAALGISAQAVRGRRILLKPNLVETAPGQAHINTHPAVVVAAADAFRELGAREVLVAEGQGHRRDSTLVLDESGMGAAIEQAGLRFVDLNHDAVTAVPNAGRWTGLGELYLPRTLLDADLVVSMPKLKTHHWAGVTAAMKNLFGVMPGVVYGWPKNVLHWAGIDGSILDICSTVRPGLAIVDGIVAMDGDGPIMGRERRLGALVMGRNLPAVDATCVRLMGLRPAGVQYLAAASSHLGPIQARNIRHHGVPLAEMRQRFEILDLPHLAGLHPTT